MSSKQALRPSRLRTAAAWTIALAWLVFMAGCTSEDPNLVGVGLGEVSIDESMLVFAAESLPSIGIFDIIEPAWPYEGSDVLYLGGTDRGDRSSILANYDFSVFDHPDSSYLLPFITVANVDSVEILLYMLTWYEPYRGFEAPAPGEDYPYLFKPWPGARKYYEVRALHEPFNVQAFPGPPPAPVGGILDMLNLSMDLAPNRGTIRLPCQRAHFIDAIQERRHIGIKIRDGLGPGGETGDPGVLGFASKEMRYAGSTLPTLGAQTVLGPALRLRLRTRPPQWVAGREWLVIEPSADVSTWHELEEPYTDPDDGIMVRTHLRSYPVLSFDLSGLPANIRINRANLVVVNDTTRSMGRQSILTCSEIPRSFVPPGRTTIDLADLEPVVSLLFGNGNWDPEHLTEHVLSFNVTSTLQRYVNDAQDGEQGFLLAAGEYIFPGWRSTPKPDFWFTKWVFHGSSAAPELRPRLEISYTRLDELTGAEGP